MARLDHIGIIVTFFALPISLALILVTEETFNLLDLDYQQSTLAKPMSQSLGAVVLTLVAYLTKNLRVHSIAGIVLSLQAFTFPFVLGAIFTYLHKDLFSDFTLKVCLPVIFGF